MANTRFNGLDVSATGRGHETATASLSPAGALVAVSAAIPTVNATNIDAGASGTAGTVDVFPTTASKGKLTIQAADNTTNHNLIVTNQAVNGANKTITLPALTGYAAVSTAALTLAEVDVLDGAGTTVVASKAVVADADKDIVGVRKIWLGTNGATGFAGELDIQDGANPGASAALTYADLVQIDGITAGTAAASKALVADANIDIAGLRNVTATGTAQAATVKVTSALAFETGTNDVTLTATGTNVIITNLPTSDPGVAGALWVDSLTLKISAGT